MKDHCPASLFFVDELLSCSLVPRPGIYISGFISLPRPFFMQLSNCPVFCWLSSVASLLASLLVIVKCMTILLQVATI